MFDLFLYLHCLRRFIIQVLLHYRFHFDKHLVLTELSCTTRILTLVS